MKKFLGLAIVAALGIAALTAALPAQSTSKPLSYEYAIVKWDGPDRLYYNLPEKFELVYLQQTGPKIPKEAQNEEFCLAVAANIMAKDGWEPITLDSRRILFRRAK